MANYEDLDERGNLTEVQYVDGAPDRLTVRRLLLVVNPRSDNERHAQFDGSRVTIGSDETGDLVLDDTTVSRTHCRLSHEGDAYCIRDLDSTNGTFINGVRIKEAFIEPGSVIVCGNTRIRFEPVDEEVELQPDAGDTYGPMVGRSRHMREVFDLIDNVGPTAASVIIEGETGTGKELVAQTLHDKSRRAEQPFVVFDCGAVPENLVESELFGHEEGSFTGAVMSREGLFEVADGGTIFLDELGELSLELQPKLLRVLEQGTIRRVGSNSPISVDVRVVAATNTDLSGAVERGDFREDLFYRLSVVRLELPPLRDRPEDIPPLVDHFLDDRDFNRDADGNRRVDAVSPDAFDALQAYPWPGNVRELVNALQRACSFASGSTIERDHLPAHIGGDAESATITPDAPNTSGDQAPAWTNIPRRADLQEQPFKEAKEAWISVFERDYLTELLVRHNGNISAAARESDLTRKHFRQLMDKHGIDTDDLDDA
jgi:DNA-binding NtrC family response regulator